MTEQTANRTATCPSCRQKVEIGELVASIHVQIPAGLVAGETLLNPEDGTPHRLTCTGNNRHRAAKEHLDHCTACRLQTNCVMTYDRQGELHRCELCKRRIYVHGHTGKHGHRQAYLT